MRILAIILGWGSKNERMLLEYYAMRRFLQTERENLSDNCTTNFILWGIVSANQEDPSPKVDASCDENDLMAVWL